MTAFLWQRLVTVLSEEFARAGRNKMGKLLKARRYGERVDSEGLTLGYIRSQNPQHGGIPKHKCNC